MGLEKIKRALPGQTGQFVLERATVKDLGENLAVVSLSEDGYQFLFDPRTLLLSVQSLRLVILHEILHVVRGDIIRLSAEDLDPPIWNIATDAVINRDLDLDSKSRFLVEVKHCISYTQMMEKLGLDPSVILSASEIYTLLRELGTAALTGFDSLEAPEKENITDKLAKHIEESRALREAAEKDGINLPKPKGAPKGLVPRRKWNPRQITRQQIILHLKRYLNSTRKTHWKRTFRRERFPLLPSLKLQKSNNIAVFIDLSGSTMKFWDIFTSIALYLRREYGASIFAFDEDVRPWDLKSEIICGGGTMFEPIATVIKSRKIHQAVIITDGFFYDDINPICDLIFVVTPEGDTDLPGKILKIGG